MKPPAFVALVVFLLLAALHQDLWNWDDARLVFGFLPVGLAYHAGYSIAVAVFWALVMKFAWPDHLEIWAAREDDPADDSASSDR